MNVGPSATVPAREGLGLHKGAAHVVPSGCRGPRAFAATERRAGGRRSPVGPEGDRARLPPRGSEVAVWGVIGANETVFGLLLLDREEPGLPLRSMRFARPGGGSLVRPSAR